MPQLMLFRGTMHPSSYDSFASQSLFNDISLRQINPLLPIFEKSAIFSSFSPWHKDCQFSQEQTKTNKHGKDHRNRFRNH